MAVQPDANPREVAQNIAVFGLTPILNPAGYACALQPKAPKYFGEAQYVIAISRDHEMCIGDARGPHRDGIRISVAGEVAVFPANPLRSMIVRPNDPTEHFREWIGPTPPWGVLVGLSAPGQRVGEDIDNAIALALSRRATSRARPPSPSSLAS